MSRRSPGIVIGILLSLALSVRGANPLEKGPPPAGLDAHGDPLPAGARARLGTVRFRHGANVIRLAASPDGKRLATLGNDRHLRLWNVDDGREVAAIPIDNTDGTMSLAFSPNGKMLLATGVTDGGGLILWDAGTGEAINTLRNLDVAVTTAAWSHDGKSIVTTDNSDSVRLWDVTTGKETRQLKWKAPAKKAARNEDKGIFGLIRWYADKLAEMGEEDGNNGGVNHNIAIARFSPDGKYLTGYGPLVENGQVSQMHFCTWDIATGKVTQAWTRAGAKDIPRLAYSPDSKVIASTDQLDEESIILLDAKTGKDLHTLGPKNPTSFAFTTDGKTIAIADSEREIRLYDVASGKEQRVLMGHPMGHYALAVLSDGRLAAAGASNQVQLWDLGAGKTVQLSEAHTGPVVGVDTTADGKHIVTRGSDGNVRFWDQTGRHIRGVTPLESGDIIGRLTAVSRDGRYFTVCTGEVDKVNAGYVNVHMHVFDLNTRKEVLNVTMGREAPTAVGFSNDSRRVAATLSGGAQLWDVGTGKQIRVFTPAAPMKPEEPPPVAVEDVGEMHTSVLAFSPDDRLLATMQPRPLPPEKRGMGIPPPDFDDGQQIVAFWEVATGKKRREFTIETEPHMLDVGVMFDDRGRAIRGAVGRGATLCFAPRGKQFLLGSGSTISLFDVAAGKEVRRFGGARLNAPSTAFSPDGKLLAAGTYDGRVCLWDVATGTALGRASGHRGEVTSVTFSADGKTLISVSADTTGLIWDVADLLKQRDAAPAALSPERLAVLWQLLGKVEGDKIDDAMRALGAVPTDAVPFLGRQLKPRTIAATPADIERSIKDLDGATFDVREKATKDLERLEHAAEKALRKAFSEPQISLEVRRRMERLLERLDAPVTDSERLRELRAIEVLEDIGTPEAKAILERLASGTPGLTITREAKTALTRLKR
jgi:WD40 repeat protein